MKVPMVVILATLLLSGSVPALGEAQPESTQGLDALEQRLTGRKFEDENLKDRVRRMEGLLRVGPPPPKTSVDYRLSRLYVAQTERARDADRKRAVEAYNRAIDQSLQGKTEEAMVSYREAIRLDNRMVEAYNNLANLLQQQMRYDETEQVYRQALAISPNEALLHRNLGILHEKAGRIQEAIKSYEIYLKLSDKPDPPIQAIVENYREHRKVAANSPDYVSAATRASYGKQLLWPSRLNPIRVHVQMTDPDQAYILPLVERSLREWEKATSSRLRFAITDAPRKANILILLKTGPLMDPFADIGHTEYQMPDEPMREGRLDFVTITLNTGTPENLRQYPLESRKEQIFRMSLHEVGHAIGIWEHSPDPGDIMFTHPIAAGLSQRDVRTIRKLYGL